MKLNLILALMWVVTSVFGQEDDVIDTTAEPAVEDSLEVLLTEPVLDSVLAFHGDSLLVPMAGQARILRDGFGIPHIYGETDADVAFGLGYAQAQDHLIPMLLSYRMAKGEAAEILGPEWIESDFKSRLWRIDHLAGEQYGVISETTRALIGGFVDGVNHYIDIHRQGMPGWVRPIRGTDVVASSRWLALLFAEVSGSPELASKGLAPTMAGAFGSNQFALAPRRTMEGNGIAGGDLHLPWTIPFRLYEAHLKSRAGLNVSGATFFGWPVIVTGHNARVAWSFTANDADIFDLYEEKLDPANPRRYVFEREKQRISVRKERVKVSSQNGVEEVTRELQYSQHGPIYKVVDNWAYAARTTADDITDLIGQLYQMNSARDLQTFRVALARLEVPLFNVTYTDIDGNLYYAFLSRTPIRAEKFDWRRPVPGWTKETDWSGILPFSQLPQIVNPESGFLQNCNTPPDAVTTPSTLDPTAFPTYLGWGAMNDRGRRALTWLSSKPLVAVDQALAFSRDEYLLAAEELKGFILRAYNRSWQELYDPEARLASAVSVLRDWDNRASVDSRAVVLFTTWKRRFDDLHSQLGEPERQDLKIIERLALEALQGAVAYMRSTFGRVDVRWGEVHRIKRGTVQYQLGGSPPGCDALHQVWSKVGEDGTFTITGGPAFTSVVELSDPPRAWTALPFGNSEDPESVHFSDQATLQRTNTLKRTWMTDEDVVANTTRILTVPFEDGALDLERRRVSWLLRARLAPVPDRVDTLEIEGESAD